MNTQDAVGLPLVIHQIQEEYQESAGLRLTAWQIQQLWRLEAVQCDLALRTLVESNFLRQTRDGWYVRVE